MQEIIKKHKNVCGHELYIRHRQSKFNVSNFNDHETLPFHALKYAKYIFTLINILRMKQICDSFCQCFCFLV